MRRLGLLLWLAACAKRGPVQTPVEPVSPPLVEPLPDPTPAAEAVDPPTLPLLADRAAFAELVRGNQRDLAHCYETALKAEPSTRGALTVELDVVDEVPRDVEITENTTGSDVFALCVNTAVSDWAFTDIPDSHVSQRFVFAPVEE